jgi:tetratricopeptide (TPR) repeat protein
MKHLWLILFVVSFANSQNSIAVLGFEGNGISKNEASSLSDRLRVELFNNGNYRVVERDKLESILEEQGLQQSGLISDEYIVNVGNIIGVQKIVVGSINKIGKLYSISARIVSVETGEVLVAVSHDHSGKLSDLMKRGMADVALELLGEKRQEVPSIGIIPLKNKGKEEDEFYSYAISADLISDVSSAGMIRVSSQQDIEKLNFNILSNDELSEKLNVRYISTGILWKRGELFQLSLELYDTKTLKVIWSDRWQEKWDNLPSIKGNLSNNILNNLDVSTKKAISIAQPGNVDAYEFYLKAKYKYDNQQKIEDVEIALGFLEKAIELDSQLIDAQRLLASIYEDEGNLDKTMELLVSLNEQLQNNGNSKEIGKTFSSIGDIYNYKEDYDKAIDYYTRSIKIAEEVNNKSEVVYATNSIGNVFALKGDFEKALDSNNRALKIARELGDKFWIGSSFGNIAFVYAKKGDFEMALDNYKRLLNTVKTMSEKAPIAFAHMGLGNIYRKMGNDDMGLDHYKHSLNISKEINNQSFIFRNSMNIGEIFYARTDYDQALDSFFQVLKIAEAFDDEEMIDEMNSVISNVYYDKGDYEEAAKLDHKGAQEKINKQKK